MSNSTPGGSDKYVWVGLSTAAKPNGGYAGERALESDRGNEYEWSGSEWTPVRMHGAINIHDADVHSVIVNKLFHQHSATSTTLAVALVGDGTEYQVTVADATGFAAGDFIHINTTSEETTHPQIVGAPAGNVITLDRRIDRPHSIGDTVTKSIVDMALTGQVGTMASPQIYWAGPVAGEKWHLTRILFSMTHATAGDNGLFGDLAKLANGCVVRVWADGEYFTLTNWKTNGDIKTDMFDVEYDARSGGGGAYGTSGRGTFKNTGAVVKLDGDSGDRLELLVQDDITAITSFTMKAQGHLEDA